MYLCNSKSDSLKSEKEITGKRSFVVETRQQCCARHFFSAGEQQEKEKIYTIESYYRRKQNKRIHKASDAWDE